MDKFYVYRPMLDLIGITEGTSKHRGYNETLGYGKFTDGDVELVKMTLTQLDALQTKMLKHPKNVHNSSACGMYQIVRTTARSIRKTLPNRYPTTRLFDAECQDEMACYLLGLRGIDKWLAGRMKEDTLINNLAKEWASLPTTSGKGAYEDQRTGAGLATVRKTLAEVKRRHQEKQPKEVVEVTIEKPVVPPAIDKEVKKKSNIFSWLSGLVGSGTLGLGWLAGIDWKGILAIGGLTIAVVVGIFVFRSYIINGIKDFREVIER